MALAPPVTLTVLAWDLDGEQWVTVYVGPSDVDEATGASAIAASVMEDPPAGLGTWAWWWEVDAEGVNGPSYYQEPATMTGKIGPSEAAPGAGG